MDINKIHTYDELLQYLLEKVDKATDDKSKGSPAFSKKTMWWYWTNQCLDNHKMILPPEDAEKILTSIKLDF